MAATISDRDKFLLDLRGVRRPDPGAPTPLTPPHHDCRLTASHGPGCAQYVVIKNVLDPATVAQLNASVDRNRELWGEPTMGGPGGCECPAAPPAPACLISLPAPL